jgi:hypothetical protein
MRLLFSTIAKYISLGLSSFADVFSSRSDTTGGLGTSTSGAQWQEVNGTINVVSGRAKASSTPTYSSLGSAYPLSVVNMSNSDVQIKLKNTNQGSTAAIWVQDSDEWWGVVSRATLQTIPGNATYGFAFTPTGNFNYVDSGNTTNYALFSSNTTNYQTNSSNTTNYKFNSSNTTNYKTNYTQVAFFNYGFNSSTSYGVANYSISYSASYGTRYNSKYSLAYTKYTWSTTNANYKATGTNYGYRVTGTYYAFNTGYSTSGSTTNYSTGVAGSTTNYGTSISGSTTNYYYNSSSTTNYYAGVGTSYGFQYQVTGANATTYAVNQYLEIIRSTASSVNTVTSALVSAVSTIKSIIVSLSNNQITAKAYSDANAVTQIGSDLVYTATGAVITTQFGISISPSQHDQSDIIGESVEIDLIV